MLKPKGYDEVRIYQNGKRLPKGGYVCEIKKLEEGKSLSGKEVLRVYLDIAEGEFKGMFSERWQNAPAPSGNEKRWGMISTIVVIDEATGEASRSLKGFITSVEESNQGFSAEKCWGDDFCKFFKGRLVGCVFGDEYFKGDDGRLRAAARPRFYLSAEKIRKKAYREPEDKYPEENAFGSMFVNTATGSDDELPF